VKKNKPSCGISPQQHKLGVPTRWQTILGFDHHEEHHYCDVKEPLHSSANPVYLTLGGKPL
jgi:hypothetical protein